MPEDANIKINQMKDKKLHYTDGLTTFCGKELDEMWYIESSAGKNIDDITCKDCLKVMKLDVI